MCAADDNTERGYDGIIVDIVAFVYHTQIFGEKAWERAKIALLDALGCAFESLQNAEARALTGPFVPGTQVPNGSKLPGTPYQLDPVKAAFDLSSLIRYLDHNDAIGGLEWGHPSGKMSSSLMNKADCAFSTDNIGAILMTADWLSRSALAEDRPSLTMKEVFRAMIKAYEIQGCLQKGNAFNKVGLDHTILVRVASTAVLSWLMGLSETQALDALSQAFIDGGPLRTFRQSPNTGPRKGWAAGDACMRAVHLCLLVKNGQPGCPSALTASRWGFYSTLFGGQEFKLTRPYANWMMENVFFKVVAVEGHAASAVEATEQIGRTIREKQLDPMRDVAQIRVRTMRAAMIIINKKGPLHNSADRDHCMQYAIAVVLLKGDMIDIADYQDNSEWANDPRVDILREKIELVEEPQFTRDYHDENINSGASAVKVLLNDGKDLDEVVVHYPMGHAQREDTAQLVKCKYERLVDGWFGDSEKAKAIKSLADISLEELQNQGVASFVDQVVSDQSLSGHLCRSVDEVYRPAFALGKTPHPSPFISYHLPFDVACRKHVSRNFFASRVYILASGSLSQKTAYLDQLISALGGKTVVNVRKAVKSHSYFSDVLEIAAELRHSQSDCVITLGGGSLTDAAKVATLVSPDTSQITRQSRYRLLTLFLGFGQ